MKRIRAENLVPGMTAAAEVSSDDGLLKLLESGTRLTHAHIAAIRSWGVPAVTVRDAAAAPARWSGVYRTEAEFLALYAETVAGMAEALGAFAESRQIPVTRLRELTERRVILLAETVGAVEYLHKIKHHSDSTFEHSLDVAIMAGILGKGLGCGAAQQHTLILAGLLHDVGKLTVPAAILEKPGSLSPDEFAAIKRHSQEGYRLVMEAGPIADGIARGILQHHERLDGSGYPHGLAGDAICAEAQVIAVADTYAAMTADRAYRAKVTPLDAMEEIAGEMFRKLNPEVALTFLNILKDLLTGCPVTLDDGQAARIVGFRAQDKRFSRPVVWTAGGELIDLQKTRTGVKRME